ncbi:MAG TPA: DUF1570 domain-containing protein [Planctomycetota bacterium]|nr:DUF1570 domain-containing protein [Planctomycetota bacterium]
MIRGLARAALGAAAFLAAAAPVRAAEDMLVLKDGRVFSGVKMAREGDFVVLKYLNGDVRVPHSMIEVLLVEGAPLPDPVTDEEKAQRAKGLVLHRGKWVPIAEREKALRKETDARRKAVEEHRKHSAWKDKYKFETRNFKFDSTQPPWQNEDYAEALEAYFKEFAKVWKIRVPQSWGKLQVCFYGSRKEYHQISGAGGNTLAYYRFVEPRELNFYYDRSDPQMSVACLFHEANHYLTDLMDESFQYPHWVNEAMAEYYGSVEWDPVKKTMKVGALQQGRLAELQSDITLNKPMGLREIVTSEDDRSYWPYYWGWSLVHFLMETPKYREKFMKFFADIARAQDVERRRHRHWPRLTELKDGAECLRVFLSRMNLQEKDLPALEKEWMDYLAKITATVSLRGNEEAGLRALRDGRRLRAMRLLKAAIDGGSKRAQVHLAYATGLTHQALESGGNGQDEALKVAENAIALDPLDAGCWAQRALLTYLSGNAPEGERLLALAREIDPEADFLDLELWVKLQVALKGE